MAVYNVWDICRWLASIEYARDDALFQRADYWQHPSDFETLQKGDCEDHSLWAWRKCWGLGIPAEFIVGKIRTRNGHWMDHSWLTLKVDGQWYVMETTAKRLSRFFIPCESAGRKYRPLYGIDTQLQTYWYAGGKRRGPMCLEGRRVL